MRNQEQKYRGFDIRSVRSGHRSHIYYAVFEGVKRYSQMPFNSPDAAKRAIDTLLKEPIVKVISEEIENPIILCGCGCGEMLFKFNLIGKQRYFINGHNVSSRRERVFNQYAGLDIIKEFSKKIIFQGIQ